MQITTPITRHNEVQIRCLKLSTEEFATILRLRPQTIRAGLCRNGHYLVGPEIFNSSLAAASLTARLNRPTFRGGHLV